MAKLEPEQEDLLSVAVEMFRSLPRGQRSSFHVVATNGGDFLHLPGATQRPIVHAGDVKMLARYGFVNLDYGRGRSLLFDITPEGFEYYEAMKQAIGGPTEAIENMVTRYLDATAFANQHGDSYTKWKQAADELWHSDSERQLTTIGHHIREAMQLFATEVVNKYQPADAPTDPEKTVARLRAVLQPASSRLGETEQPFLGALIDYWGTVSDLAQRQEHGAAKSIPLLWEDARRLVFQTANVMFELDRAFTRAIV